MDTLSNTWGVTHQDMEADDDMDIEGEDLELASSLAQLA